MANVLIDENTMKAIGNSIRGKTGDSALILPADMPAAIDAIETGGGGAEIDITSLCEDDYGTKYGAFAMITPNDAFYKALFDGVKLMGTSCTYLYPPYSITNANKDIVYHYYETSPNPSNDYSIYMTKGDSITAASKLKYAPKVILHGTNISQISLTMSQAFDNTRFNQLQEFDYHDFVECADIPLPDILWTQSYACFRQTSVKKVVLPARGTSDWSNTFQNCGALEEIYMGVGNVPGHFTPDDMRFSNTFKSLPVCHTIEITGADENAYNNNTNCILDFSTVGFGYSSANNSNTAKADSVYSRTQFMNTVNKLFPSHCAATIKVAAGAGANNADGGMDALTDAEIASIVAKGWTLTKV